jgi:hypothetical protein
MTSTGRVCSAWIQPWVRCYVSVMEALMSIIGPESFRFVDGVGGVFVGLVDRNARNVLETALCPGAYVGRILSWARRSISS